MEAKIEEIWKDVVGYEGLYEISSIGRIKSSYSASHKPKRLIKTSINVNGYPSVGLYKDQRSQTHRVHRLVAMAFIPMIDGKPYINHKDGNKRNNNVSNLEWCTASENIKHAFANGLSPNPIGSKNPKTTLTDEQVTRIRRKWEYRQATKQDLARIYNVTVSAIQHIVDNRTWKHILE